LSLNGLKLDGSQNSAGYKPGASPVILLGLGFTTCRLARRLLLRATPVFGVAREPSRFRDLAYLGLRVEQYSLKVISVLPKGAVIVHTVPPLSGPEQEELHALMAGLEPRRVLYISSTSVYGAQPFVTERSAVAPSDLKGLGRVEEEIWLRSQPWSNLIVRPAAIYGPGRGVHVRVREGKPPRGGGAAVVSRIHADDLAAILEAGLESNLEGAWPCADEHPCSSDAIAEWCSRLLKTEPRPSNQNLQISGRIVDGRKIRELFGLKMLYPDYFAGILASISEESGLDYRAPAMTGAETEVKIEN
jgi:nucleoside-diphosphate-sugar epimerase